MVIDLDLELAKICTIQDPLEVATRIRLAFRNRAWLAHHHRPRSVFRVGVTEQRS